MQLFARCQSIFTPRLLQTFGNDRQESLAILESDCGVMAIRWLLCKTRTEIIGSNPIGHSTKVE